MMLAVELPGQVAAARVADLQVHVGGATGCHCRVDEGRCGVDHRRDQGVAAERDLDRRLVRVVADQRQRAGVRSVHRGHEVDAYRNGLADRDGRGQRQAAQCEVAGQRDVGDVSGRRCRRW